MILAFNSKLLRDICENESIAIQYFDTKVLSKLFARISDIKASRNIYDLPIGKPDVDGIDCVIEVIDKIFIKLRQNYPEKEGESVVYDWKTVGRVRLMGISNVK